jgi:hypothetical protein
MGYLLLQTARSCKSTEGISRIVHAKGQILSSGGGIVFIVTDKAFWIETVESFLKSTRMAGTTAIDLIVGPS